MLYNKHHAIVINTALVDIQIIMLLGLSKYQSAHVTFKCTLTVELLALLGSGMGGQYDVNSPAVSV